MGKRSHMGKGLVMGRWRIAETTGPTRETAHRMALGQLYATTGALAACRAAGVDLPTLLDRHTRGDCGELGCHTVREGKGVRVKSSYSLPTDKTVWLITEPDRAVTLLLLPEEF